MKIDNLLALALAGSLGLAFFSTIGIRWYHETHKDLEPRLCEMVEFQSGTSGSGTILSGNVCRETAEDWGFVIDEQGVARMPKESVTTESMDTGDPRR